MCTTWVAAGPPLIELEVNNDAAVGIPVPQSAFAVRVLSYVPADGIYVNDPLFNDPAHAIGAPVGGGTFFADQSKLVTLGNFGGSITLAFDHMVQDDPENPFGLDAIVFGNGFWVGGNPMLRWAESATIEISQDTNHNGIADEQWYLIPGSHIIDPQTQQQDGYYILPDDPFADLPLLNDLGNGMEAHFGYADMSPVLRLGDTNGDNIIDDTEMIAETFYTVPDDPLLTGITDRSGGGDAFDIAWAIDPVTGENANLTGFHFIRLTTAVDGEISELGEISAEIGGVSDVTPGFGLHTLEDPETEIHTMLHQHLRWYFIF